MCAVTFRLLLVFNSEAKLLAVSVVLTARIEINLAGYCGLDVRIKYYDVLQPFEVVPNYLKKQTNKKAMLLHLKLLDLR